MPWGRFLARCGRSKSHKTISNHRKHLNEEADGDLFLNFVSLIFDSYRKITHVKNVPILNNIK